MLRIFIVIYALMAWTSTSVGQTKEDIVAVIKAISEVPDLEPVFQVQLSEGPTMVILKSDKMGANPNEIERQFFLLTDDDFWGFNRSVKIMTTQEADRYGVKRDMMVNLGLSFSEDNCNARLSAGIEENEQLLQGSISLIKSGFDWEVKGKHVQIR